MEHTSPIEGALADERFGGDQLVSIDDLLERGVAEGASDLHIAAGSPPKLRIHGELNPIPGYDVFDSDTTEKIIYQAMTSEQQRRLESDRQVDFSYVVPGISRFRVNVYFQRTSISAALRAIPHEITPIDTLGLPHSVHNFVTMPRGLVLVTGPTGSGKSTTLAAIIDEINRTRSDHIVTVEDPIEFVHSHKKCLVNQREVGTDALGFAEALRGALRQDPDVILVGEMRDLETIATALTAAETGHLVFGTLHTQDAPSTVDRVIDAFPPAQQNQVRVQLAATLQGIVSQSLLPTLDGKGRVAATEILLPDDATRNLIRQSKIEQVYSIIQTGSTKGMHTLEQSLAELVTTRQISTETAMNCTSRPTELKQLLPDSFGAGAGEVSRLRTA